MLPDQTLDAIFTEAMPTKTLDGISKNTGAKGAPVFTVNFCLKDRKRIAMWLRHFLSIKRTPDMTFTETG